MIFKIEKAAVSIFVSSMMAEDYQNYRLNALLNRSVLHKKISDLLICQQLLTKENRVWLDNQSFIVTNKLFQLSSKPGLFWPLLLHNIFKIWFLLWLKTDLH